MSYHVQQCPSEDVFSAGWATELLSSGDLQSRALPRGISMPRASDFIHSRPSYPWSEPADLQLARFSGHVETTSLSAAAANICCCCFDIYGDHTLVCRWSGGTKTWRHDAVVTLVL